jgi:hypothetical protein
MRKSLSKSLSSILLRFVCALVFSLVWVKVPPAVAQDGGATSSRPTFDCAKAKSSLAVLICSREDTAQADWDLSAAALARYFSLDERGKTDFWKDQDKWLRSISQKCQLTNQAPPFPQQKVSCVVSAYKGRAAAYRSKLTGDALAESKLSREQLVLIQKALSALGFLSGEADGEFGLVTRAAIRKYQEAN